MPRQIVPVTDVASILLTQDEGDLRYLPLSYVPPATDLSNYWTKAQADGRYEPLDSAYTKAEADAKYLTQVLGDARYSLTSHLHTGVYQPVGSYSLTSHNHDSVYSVLAHNHDAAYSPVAHNHDAGYLKLSGGTLTGDLLFKGGFPSIDADTNYKFIRFRRANGALRWQIGTDAGGEDFWLYSYTDAGAGTGNAFSIARANGALVVTPAAESAAIRIGYGFGNQGWIGCERTDGRMVMNTGASGLHQWAFGPWFAGTVKMALDSNGRVTLGSARSDQPAVVFGESTMLIKNDGVFGLMEIHAPAYGIDTYVNAVRTYMIRTDAIAPMPDNSRYCGTGANRWIAVFAVAGSINTSAAEAKKNFKPLDPASCTAAVLETDWLSYEYLPPPPPEREEGETNTDRMRVLDGYLVEQAKTAHVRKQNGYVLGHPTHKTHDLFGLSDRQSASPSADLGILACALQSALQRIAALEGKPV